MFAHHYPRITAIDRTELGLRSSRRITLSHDKLTERTRNPKVIWEDPVAAPHAEMDSSAAHDTSRAMPTADDSVCKENAMFLCASRP